MGGEALQSGGRIPPTLSLKLPFWVLCGLAPSIPFLSSSCHVKPTTTFSLVYARQNSDKMPLEWINDVLISRVPSKRECLAIRVIMMLGTLLSRRQTIPNTDPRGAVEFNEADLESVLRRFEIVPIKQVFAANIRLFFCVLPGRLVIYLTLNGAYLQIPGSKHLLRLALLVVSGSQFVYLYLHVIPYLPNYHPSSAVKATRTGIFYPNPPTRPKITRFSF